MAGVGRFGRKAWMSGGLKRWLLPRSFRGRFVLFVGAAVLLGLLFSGGTALKNVNELSDNATREIESGLTGASREYLSNYIETTAQRADLVIDQVHSEVATLAGTMQTLIDRPESQAAIGAALLADKAFNVDLEHNPAGNWTQNAPGAPSVVSIWGYLLGPDKKPRADVQRLADESAIFDLASTNLMASGTPKLQVYYVGPKSAPIMRTTPYSPQAQTFDKLYPGHNEANFWDFFFPGVYEAWQGWIKDAARVPVPGSYVTETIPYVDATTGALIVSYFHPLWTRDRADVAGMAAADVTLEQLAGIVEDVRLAQTGFAFLARSTGNVLAVRPAGEQTLGLRMANASGEGVTALDRTLQQSAHPAVAALKLPKNEKTVITQVWLEMDGKQVPYTVALRNLGLRNLWPGKGDIEESHLVLGFVVPDNEIYASLHAAQEEVSSATQGIIKGQTAALIGSMLLVLAAIFAISGRITGGLRELSAAAKRMKDKDYTRLIEKPGDDEVGEVASAFNSMAEEIRYHTENLEHIVADRTRELDAANRENLKLNKKLKKENRRLGAELDVARRIQMMVLPRPAELAAVSGLDIAAYMEPADEIGGDYYDVLQVGGRVKVGIGDVTGHGLESGVLMLMVQSVARGLQEQGDSDPARFLAVLNRAVYKNVERTQTGKHLSLAFVDYSAGEAVISGQHEEILVVRAGGDVERIDTNDLGFPIGLEPEIEAFVATKRVSFQSGDVMVLYTDGINEAESPSGELFGMERLCESARAHRGGDADAICKSIIADLMAFISTQKVHDDITLVVLKHR